jgi:hypothetical protein
MKSIILGSVFVTLFSAAKAVAPEYLTFLPLGGSAIAEAGIVLSVSVCIATLIETFWSRK